MKKRNLVLQTVAAACLAVIATSASAVVALSPSAASTPVKYAKELTSANVTVSGGALNVTFSPAWGVSTGNHLYARIDLTNATFATALTSASLTSSVGTTVVTISSGGGVGQNFVIFDLSDPSVGINLADVITMTPGSLKYIDPAAAATIKVNVYDTASLANAGAAGLGYTLNDNYITTAKALVTTFTPLTNTAAVSTGFKQFAANASGINAAGVVQPLGSVQTVVNSAGALQPATGAAAVAADFATAADLVVTGMFASAANISASATAACGGLTAGTINTGKTTATFTGFAGAALTAAKSFVCFTGDGATAIPAQVDTGVLTYTGVVAGATPAVENGTVGTILHDGTELQTPWFSTAPGYISRLFLTNTGTTDATISGYSIITEAGNTCTAGTGRPTSIPAGKMITVDAASLCSAFVGGANRAAVVVTIEQPTTQIQGVYQIINPTSGAQTAYPMLRPGTN